MPVTISRKIMATTLAGRLVAQDGAGVLAGIDGFRILGTNASSAAPDLIRFIQRHKPSQPCVGAIYALGHIGTEGLPILSEILTNGLEPNRSVAAYAIGTIPDLGTNAETTIRLLARSVDEGNLCAVMALGALRREPDIAVPALTNALLNQDSYFRLCAVIALGKFGPPAKSAAPALFKALEDSELPVRTWATNSLSRIAP
jgi:HEAT repeat protein